MIRLMAEIKRWTDDPDDLPNTREDILEVFPEWIEKVRKEAYQKGVRAIVVIDGLNQLENREGARQLGWLPSNIFTGPLRLITSTLPDDTWEIMNARGWSSFQIKALRPDERRKMIADYLSRFSKRLDNRHLNRIAFATSAANPLYLKILLDELYVTGTHDKLDERIDQYLSAPDILALLGQVLSRYQSDYERDHPGLVCDAMGLIWSARRGLSEAELLQLIPPKKGSVLTQLSLPKKHDSVPHQLPLAIWSPLRAALGEALVDRGGILNFSHDYLRSTVERIFVPNKSKQEAFRLQLANFFENKNVSPRSCDETPWLLKKIKQRKRLRHYLLNIDVFHTIIHANENDLTNYWLWLGELNKTGASYLSAFEQWCKSNLEADWKAQSWNANELALFLKHVAQYQTAEFLYRKSLSIYIINNGRSDVPEVAIILRNLSDLLREAGRVDEATALLRRALETEEKIYSSNDLRLAESLHALG
jgi:tetratricopeptide (TPR) repeat protein